MTAPIASGLSGCRVADLALRGMATSTTPDDWHINKQFQMMRFDGARWVLFGPILTDEYKTN
jgi:branched-chain amino acid transport system substrate-binding protein